MRNLRSLCAAALLTLALAAPASAGNIHTPVATPPPSATEQESTGDEATAPDSVTEVALDLLRSVLSLF